MKRLIILALLALTLVACSTEQSTNVDTRSGGGSSTTNNQPNSGS